MGIILSLTSHWNGKHICIKINAENKQCVTNATFRAFSFTHSKDDKMQDIETIHRERAWMTQSIKSLSNNFS